VDETVRLFRRDEWRDQARCRGVGHDIFFSSDRLDQLTALAYCRGCPVRRQCAVSATGHREQGTWGGLTEEERVADAVAAEWQTAG
jgi:hypothetical protein